MIAFSCLLFSFVCLAHSRSYYYGLSNHGSKGDGFCAGKDDGNYRDPDNCHGFITCSNQIAYKMNCNPPSLKYNETTDQCDWPQNVQCGQGAGFCSGKADGMYPDPDSCYWYITCQKQIAKKYNCGPNMKFNEFKHSCDFPENVQCGQAGFCSGKADGRYRDPDNCHWYIICENQIRFKYNCGPNMKYNEKIGSCDRPYNEECGQGVGLCSGIADGNYRDHDHCYRYISCVDQIAQRYSCGSLKFNEKIGSCDIGNNVECGQEGSGQAKLLPQVKGRVQG